MKRVLIDANSVADRLEREYAVATGEAREAFREALEIVLDAPEVSVQEVEHGEWLGVADGYYEDEQIYDMWRCSECGCGCETDYPEEKPKWHYCPNCGAKMDGGTENALD